MMPGRTLLLAGALLIGSIGAAAADPGTIGSLRFLGATTIPNDAEVDGTSVGGLSGLDYNPATGTWAIVSDDKSDHAPARFYLARIDLSAGAPKVSFEQAVILQQADGKPYPNTKAGGDVPDPESIRFDASGSTLWWSTEGDRKLGLSPFVRQTGLDGRFIGNLALPAMFTVAKDQERRRSMKTGR
jgi:hypothetical protein